MIATGATAQLTVGCVDGRRKRDGWIGRIATRNGA